MPDVLYDHVHDALDARIDALEASGFTAQQLMGPEGDLLAENATLREENDALRKENEALKEAAT